MEHTTQRTREVDQPNWLRHPAVLTFALVFMTLVAYAPALNAGYIWDDDDYLTHNPLIENLDGLVRIWQPLQTRQYYPLVFSSFWIEHKIWGFEPGGYHFINILLHALSAILIWRIASWLKLPGAWLIAAVFALHPVHVESVAWITERKNTLSAVCYLLAMLTYLKFDAQRERGEAKWGRYAGTLVLFVAALLSKSVTASLPIAIVIVLLFKREKLSVRRLWPLVPFVLVGVALGLNTAYVEQVNVGAVGAEFSFTWLERWMIASRSLLFYPFKLVVPWPLCFFYPQWSLGASSVLAWLPTAGVVGALGASVWLWMRGVRWPACALAFFAVTIFPALGFVSVYPMRYSFVADHFQYLASLGIIAGVIAPVASLLRGRTWNWIAATLLLAILGTLTFRQTLAYKNEETLWRDTIACNAESWAAMNNLAGILLVDAQEAQQRGDAITANRKLDEASSLLKTTLQLRPNEFRAHSQLSDALRLQGRLDEALAEQQRAHDALIDQFGSMNESQRQRAKWPIAESFYKLARLQTLLGKPDDAIRNYLDALGAFPNFPTAFLELAQVFASQGKLEEAAATYSNLLKLEPDVLIAHQFLGDFERDHGRWSDALTHYRKVYENAVDQAAKLRAMDRAARILATCPDANVRNGAMAIRLAQAVCEATDRQAVFPLQTLAAAYAEAGQFEEAINAASAALAIAQQLNMQDAITQLNEQIELYRAGTPWHASAPQQK